MTSATSARALAVASFAAGVATGFRSQVAWLTVPLLIMKLLVARGWLLGERHLAASNQQPATRSQQLATSTQQLATVLAAFTAGILLWFVPLVIISGGPLAY
jgi:hypothetical protein